MADAAKTVYTMLSFQYKPLERRMIAELSKHPTGAPLIAQYRQASYARKIAILDRYAAFMGLG